MLIFIFIYDDDLSMCGKMSCANHENGWGQKII